METIPQFLQEKWVIVDTPPLKAETGRHMEPPAMLLQHKSTHIEGQHDLNFTDLERAPRYGHIVVGIRSQSTVATGAKNVVFMNQFLVTIRMMGRFHLGMNDSSSASENTSFSQKNCSAARDA